MRLHRTGLPPHGGIVLCTENRDYADFAARIDDAIRKAGSLENKLLRVARGSQ